MEEYEEVETEIDDVTFDDILFVGGTILFGCIVIAFLTHLIKRTFKNLHFKIGDKIEVGLETKEDK